MKYLITYNESIKDYLKPKSDEQFIKGFENLSPYNIFKMSMEHNLKIGFKYLVDNDLIDEISKYIVGKYELGLYQNQFKDYEEYLLNILINMEKIRSTIDSDIIIYKKDDIVLFNYNEKDKSIYMNYNEILIKLMKLFKLKWNSHVIILVKGMSEKYLNIKIDKVGTAWIDFKHGRELITT